VKSQQKYVRKSSSIPGISVGKRGLRRPDRLLLDPEIGAGQGGGFLAAYGGRAAQQRVRRPLGQAAVHCQRDGGILASAQKYYVVYEEENSKRKIIFKKSLVGAGRHATIPITPNKTEKTNKKTEKIV
jgi:hypothetical protein